MKYFVEHEVQLKELDALFLKHWGFSFTHDLSYGEAYIYLRRYVKYSDGVKAGLERGYTIENRTTMGSGPHIRQKRKGTEADPPLLRRRRSVKPTRRKTPENS